MLHNYDYPEYTRDDPDYEFCASPTECRVLRMLKTYVELVTGLYGKPHLTLCSFEGPRNFRNVYRDRYDAMCELADQLDEAGVEDPGHFIAFLMETWKNRGNYHKYVKSDTPWLAQMPGVAYLSLREILRSGPAQVPVFAAIPDYKPRQIVPSDDLAAFDRWVMQRRVERWCLLRDATAEEYWLQEEHLFPPHLTAPWVQYAESLHECEEAIQEKFGFSIQELHTFLVELQRAMDDPTTAKKSAGTVVAMDEEEPDPVVRDRIAAYQEAIDRGVDVSAPWFEKKVEDEVNPIDTEHPDTIMWYLHSAGQPVRLDGEGEDSD
jgi:hypothetical protein